MADRSAGNVSVRFSVQDEQTVRKALEGLGKDGQQALDRLNAAGKQPSRTLMALSDITGTLRSQVTGTAQSLGVAGDALLRFGPVGLVAGAALGAIAYGLYQVSERTGAVRQLARDIKEGAEQTRFSTSQYQSFIEVLSRHGIETEAARSALTRFATAHAQAADGEGELYKVLRTINPELAEQFANARAGAEALDVYARATANATAKQQTLADRAAFGRGGAAFRTSVTDVAEAGGLDALARSYENLNVIRGPRAVEALAQAAEKSRQTARETVREWDSVALTIGARWKALKQSIGMRGEDDASQFARGARIVTEWLFGKEEQDQARKLQQEIDKLQHKIDYLKGVGAAPSWFDAAVKAFGNTKEIEREIARLESLQEARRKALQRIPAAAPAPVVAALPPDVQAQIDTLEFARRRLGTAAAASMDPQEVRRYANEIANVDAQLKELRATKKATAEQPIRTQTEDEAREKEIERLTRWIKLEKERLSLLSDLPGIEARRLKLAQEELRLESLQKAPRVTGAEGEAIDRARILRSDAFTGAQRERLGIAGEEEMLLIRLRQLQEQRAAGVIKTDEEMAAAERIVRKEIRETAEQLAVRASATPALTRFVIESRDTLKQLDQGLASAANNVTENLADIAMQTKKPAEAFKEMVNSILRDALRLSIRQGITGPGAEAFSGFLKSFFAPTGHEGALIGYSASGYRQVPIAAFYGARRYHSGTPWLGADEVPFIGKRGELVGWPDQMREAFGGNQQPTVLQVKVENRNGSRVEAKQKDNGEFVIAINDAVNSLKAGMAAEVSRGQGPLSRAISARARRQDMIGA